eukprot:scaffold13199_cov62-Attheya_sp.AAC.9
MHSIIKTKADDSNVNTKQEAFGLEASFAGEGMFNDTGIKTIVKNWVFTEDDPIIIDAQVDAAIELFENKASTDQALLMPPRTMMMRSQKLTMMTACPSVPTVLKSLKNILQLYVDTMKE